MRRRPIKITTFVWCDHHCTIHVAEADAYDEGARECKSNNWRPVYVLGEPHEEF